jgi:alkylation response protein AidB-like acyl-CoA dehydrogenase
MTTKSKADQILIDTSKMNKAEREALEVSEDARSMESIDSKNFIRELFAGRFCPKIINPFPEQSSNDKKIGDLYLKKLETFLIRNVDPVKIDEEQKIPDKVIRGLAKLGIFGLKIEKKYGGLEFSQVNYNRVISLVASYCSSTAVLISAHQSIGVATPLKYHGTKEQRQKFLPKIAKGAISAGVGSDPAQMKTTAKLAKDKKYYILNGEKLWITNGPIADLIVVMAQTAPKIINGKERKQISAFIVETKSKGFSIKSKCSFMGLRGISNGLLSFNNVKVPKENLIWDEGKGLKLALETLNSGRLAIPAAALGMSKQALRFAKVWANKRVQWGSAIGKHEAVASKLNKIAINIFAIEAITWLTSNLLDKGRHDVKIEAAVAKLFSSEASWEIADDALQIRGGRGYETTRSLKDRKDQATSFDRMLRDSRINRIIEGTSEIMYLLLAREALDMHLKVGGKLLLPGTPLFEKIKTLFKAGFFYLRWYPSQWINLSCIPFRHLRYGKFANDYRYVERKSHKLARKLFHKMMRHQIKLEKKQLLLSRFINIGIELFVISAIGSYANYLMKSDSGNSETYLLLAKNYIRLSKDKIKRNFYLIKHNNDKDNYRLARNILSNNYNWFEENIVKSSLK